jgi:hypothetical protein
MLFNLVEFIAYNNQSLGAVYQNGLLKMMHKHNMSVLINRGFIFGKFNRLPTWYK